MRRRLRLPIPWGLLIVLAVYFGSVWAYVRVEYCDSPQYAAARSLQRAELLLGRDDGLTAEISALFEALDHLLRATRAVPDDGGTLQRIEIAVRRLRERGVKLPRDTQAQIDGMSLRLRDAQASRKAVLLIGARDLWDVDGLLAAPQRIYRQSLLGAAFIVLLWIYKTVQGARYVRMNRVSAAERRSGSAR